MDDLAAWLTQILDDQQAKAEQASPGPWHLNAEGDEVLAVDDIEVTTAFALSSNQQRWTAAHIAEHDPAAILARIAADRQILAQYTDARESSEAIQETFADDDSPFARAERAGYSQTARALGTVVRLLALPYADRPGYQEAWKPE